MAINFKKKPSELKKKPSELMDAVANAKTKALFNKRYKKLKQSLEDAKIGFDSLTEERKLLDGIVRCEEEMKIVWKNLNNWPDGLDGVPNDLMKRYNDLDKTIKEQRRTFDKMIFDIISVSDYKVDKYGIPKYAYTGFKYVKKHIDRKELMKSVLDYIENNLDDPRIQGTTREQRLEEVSELMKHLPLIVQLTRDRIGEEMQGIIKPLLNEAMDSVLRVASKKKGKRYISKTEQKIIQKLEIYWDDNLPLGDNRKSYFNKIADDYGKSFDAIKKIEKRNRPSTFKPSRK